MGYIWAIYYLYLLTYLLLPFPVGYPSYYPAGTRVKNYPDTAALAVYQITVCVSSRLTVINATVIFCLFAIDMNYP